MTSRPGGSARLALDEDHHVHSTFSDDAVSTLAENVRAARERGLRVTLPRRPRAPGHGLGAGVRGRRARAAAGARARAAGRGGSQDPEPGRGAGPAGRAARGGPGADRRSPVPRRPRAGAAAGHAGRDGRRRELGARGHRLPDRGHARRPGAGRPGRSWPTCSACCPRWGWTRRTCPARPWPPGPGLHRAGALVEVNEKWACPSPRTIRALAAAGVPLVASTDSHDCATSGATPGSGSILDERLPPTAVP